MMITVFICMLMILLRPNFYFKQVPIQSNNRPSDKYQPKQWMVLPKPRPGTTRKSYRDYVKRYTIKMFKRKMFSLRTLLRLNVILQYEHERKALYRLLITQSKSKLSWRMKHPFYAFGYFMQDLKRSSARLRVDTGGMADWYFSASGDDTTGDGSIGTPWETVEKFNTEVGNSTFSSGDNIYFNRGDDFRASVRGGANDLMDLNEAGINVTAYGSGDMPVVEYVYPRANNLSVSYLHIDNQDHSGHDCIEGLDTGNANSMTISNCEFENCRNCISFQNSDYSNLTISDCYLDLTSVTGLGIGLIGDDTEHPTGISIHDIVYDNCNSSMNEACIYFHEASSTSANYIEGPITVYTISWTNYTGCGEEVIDLVSGTYINMFDIQFKSTSGRVFSINHTAGKSTVADGNVQIHHCYFEMDDNTNQSVFTIATPNVWIYNSLIISNGSRSAINVCDSGWYTNEAPGVNAGWQIEDVRIYYCTIMDSGASGYGVIISQHDTTDGFLSGAIVVRNCIVTTTEANMSTRDFFYIHGAQRGSYSIGDAYFDFDNNCYYDPGSSAGFNGSTFAQWQTAGQDANGMESDPKLVSRTGTGTWPTDAKLASDSPCINAALNIGAGSYYNSSGNVTSGIIDDYDGTSRATDIGMYEYSSGDAPPPSDLGLENINVVDINYVFT